MKLHTQLASLLVIFLALSGCATTAPTTPVDQDLQLAQKALLSGHADNALTIYKEKLKQTPNNAKLLFLAGSACNQVSRFDEALHYLRKGSAIAPSPAFSRELGRAYLALGDLNKAQQELENAAQATPNDDVALNSLGVTYSLLKEYPNARKVYNQALAIKPDSLEYRNNLALAWMLEGSPQKAIAILYPIFQRGESSKKMNLNLALSYALIGDVDAAKAIARKELSNSELKNNTAYYQMLASNGGAE